MAVLNAYRERNSPSFSLHISQMLNVSVFGNTAHIYAAVHVVRHACQHITVDQSHSSGDTVAKIWRLAVSGGTKTVSFTNPPQKKSSHRVKSGDRGGHHINASSSWRLAGSGGTKTVSFTKPQKKNNRTGLNPVIGVATALTRLLLGD